MSRILKSKRIFLGISMALVMVFTLVMAGTVYADDGTQPAEPAPAAQPTAADENTPTAAPEDAPAVEDTEVAPAETPAADVIAEAPTEGSTEPVAEAPTEATAAPVEQPPEAIVENAAEAPAVDSSTMAEAAAVLAEDELTLVDESGEAIDLASQDSLEAVTGGDPWWIVAGVKYAYVKSLGACPSDVLPANCFVHATTPISAALAYMDANNLVPTDGILHVEPDTYSETTITVDGSAGNGYLANLKGLVSSGTSATTTLVANVTVSNTLLGFTLSGFTITGALDIHDNIGVLNLNDLNVTNTSGAGIQVTNHNGAVNVTNVRSSHNRTYGMTVDNTAGTLGVTITNSEFSHNNDSNPSYYWAGLMVDSKGIITLNGVAACNNDGNGATLVAAKGTVVKNSVFNGNLAVPVMGGVGYGLFINNNVDTSNNVSLENVQADSNTNYGMYIYSAANVTLKNVNASLNGVSSGYHGVLINNRSGSGTVSVTNSTFNQNGDDGLRILSLKNVTLNGITAQENSDNGVFVDNCNLSGGTCLGTGTISITGNLPNYFSDNGEDGLYVLSKGNVTLSNFQANGNTSSGLEINNNFTGSIGTVTLNVTYIPTIGTWTNTASDNSEKGLQLVSFGNISIDKCQFEGNSGSGAYLDNSSATGAKTVSIKNSDFSNNNSTGLQINSLGNITVNNVNSYDNPAGCGLNIDNSYGTGNVTISGVGTVKNNYSGNSSYGIEIQSSGVVTLANVDATENATGITIDNTYGVGKSVTIANVDCSDSTSSEGLLINSKGAITITDILSNNNPNNPGAVLQNYGAATPQNVKITRGQFNDNTSSNGLLINTLGTITLTSVQANHNGGSGAWMDSCQYNGGTSLCDGSGGLTVTGTGNSFSNNDSYGMYILSRNSIALSNVIVDNNGLSGVYITHAYDNCIGTISLTSSGSNTSSFSNNGSTNIYSYGFYAYSYGTISLSGFVANNNTSNGVYLYNSGSLTPKDISVSNAKINNNQETGLKIFSKGAVTLSGVEISDSSKHYWEINDDSGQYVHDRLPYQQTKDEVWWFKGSASQSVSIDLVSSDFDAYVELYDSEWHLLRADDNSGGGTDASLTYILPSLQTYYIKVKSAITGEYGNYELTMDGSSPSSISYYYYGADISNTSGSGDVKINNNASLGYGLKTHDNNYDGMYIYSNGNISLNGVNASYNGYGGIGVYNNSTENKSVSLTNCIFDHNGSRGAHIESLGPISWSGGSASENKEDYGAELMNDDSSAARIISISNVVFDDNETNGLMAYSLGKITLTSVGASNNLTGDGAYLDNCRTSSGACQGSGDILISGTYGQLEFNHNSSFGLVAYSRGLISLTNVNASGNHNQDGLYLVNNYSNATAGITVKTTSPLTPSQFSENYQKGVNLNTNGPVILANLTANDNLHDSGIYVYNSTAAQPATMSHITLRKNGGYGLTVDMLGAISLDYAEVVDNGMIGVRLVNSSAATAQPLTVSHARISGQTTDYGLYLVSNGLITLNNVSSNNNRTGVFLNNDYGYVSGVKFLSTFGENNFNNNTYTGVSIVSNGEVNLSKTTANWNGYSGFNIDTSGKLIGSALYTYRNMQYGMFIQADGGVSLSTSHMYNNGSGGNYDGLHIVVLSGSPVSITNSVITGNYGDGIEISGNTNPTLTGTCYFGNDSNGSGDRNLRTY